MCVCVCAYIGASLLHCRTRLNKTKGQLGQLGDLALEGQSTAQQHSVHAGVVNPTLASVLQASSATPVAATSDTTLPQKQKNQKTETAAVPATILQRCTKVSHQSVQPQGQASAGVDAGKDSCTIFIHSIALFGQQPLPSLSNPPNPLIYNQPADIKPVPHITCTLKSPTFCLLTSSHSAHVDCCCCCC